MAEPAGKQEHGLPDNVIPLRQAANAAVLAAARAPGLPPALRRPPPSGQPPSSPPRPPDKQPPIRAVTSPAFDHRRTIFVDRALDHPYIMPANILRACLWQDEPIPKKGDFLDYNVTGFLVKVIGPLHHEADTTLEFKQKGSLRAEFSGALANAMQFPLKDEVTFLLLVPPSSGERTGGVIYQVLAKQTAAVVVTAARELKQSESAYL